MQTTAIPGAMVIAWVNASGYINNRAETRSRVLGGKKPVQGVHHFQDYLQNGWHRKEVEKQIHLSSCPEENPRE
jgi:hypothetical protein